MNKRPKMKRSGKWYRRNEKEIMESLGLVPTPNSGSGWIVKEDGQNENVIGQLKSTDKRQMTISVQDIQKLEYNAMVAHKLPIFVIDFINVGQYIVIAPELLQDVSKYLTTGSVPERESLVLEPSDDVEPAPTKVIKSDYESRTEMRETIVQKYKKKGKSAL